MTGIGRSVIACVVILTACRSGPQLVTPPAPQPDAAAVRASVYLIGDAGAPKPGDPVLAALSTELRSRTAPATVVFLGDNVYPVGIPAEGDPARAEAERRLLAQVDVVRGTDAAAVFLPGNHDWGRSASDGWQRIRRQQTLIERAGVPNAVLLPPDGCPGPELVPVTSGFTLVALDTQWWLHPHAKPTDGESACASDAPGEITARIRELVAADSGWVGVVAHHPVVSGGIHGGHFSLLDHLFPLRALKSWLWVPLPIIGSAYPIARASGISNQDLPGRKYRELVDSLRAAFAGGPILFYAAGHEHNLQVVRDSTFGHVLISGAGYFDHTTRTVYLVESRYAAAASGYMRVDVLTDGRVRLGVMVVEVEDVVSEAFSMWLLSDPEG
jgi:hypothetical protein